MHSKANPFPLLGRHPLPTVMHVPAHTGAMRPVMAKASKQNAAENQQPEALPKANHPPPEERRQQPIPQMHHHFPEEKNEQHERRWGE